LFSFQGTTSLPRDNFYILQRRDKLVNNEFDLIIKALGLNGSTPSLAE
jgi:hypothetical protein